MEDLQSISEWNEVYEGLKKENHPTAKKDRGYNTHSAVKTNIVNDYKKFHMFDELDIFKGIYNYAKDVHHIVPLSKANNKDELRFLSQHPMNMMSLTEQNHLDIHYANEKFTKEQLMWVHNRYQLVMDDLLLYLDGKLPVDYFKVNEDEPVYNASHNA